MEIVNITFKNGQTLEAELNGTSLITNIKPDFPNDLSEVSVDGERIHERYKNPKIVECVSVDGRYWFSFQEIPESERIIKQMQANIEYIAMMADITMED